MTTMPIPIAVCSGEDCSCRVVFIRACHCNVVVRVAIDYLALLLVDLRSVIPATTNSGYYFIIDKRDVCKTYAYGLLCVSESRLTK